MKPRRLQIGLVIARHARRSEVDLNPCLQALDGRPCNQPGAYLHGGGDAASDGTAGSGDWATLIGDGPQQPGEMEGLRMELR